MNPVVCFKIFVFCFVCINFCLYLKFLNFFYDIRSGLSEIFEFTNTTLSGERFVYLKNFSPREFTQYQHRFGLFVGVCSGNLYDLVSTSIAQIDNFIFPSQFDFKYTDSCGDLYEVPRGSAFTIRDFILLTYIFILSPILYCALLIVYSNILHFYRGYNRGSSTSEN